MEKTWNELSDRCSLFFDAPSGFFKELLKEAEGVLVNKCGLLKQKFTYEPQSGSEHNAFSLPLDYKHMLGVWVNGNKIEHKDKTEWSFNKGSTTDNPVMEVSKGTPNYYCVINTMITLDKIPSSSDTIDIYYQASLEEHLGGRKAVLIENRADNWARINTLLRDELIDRYVRYVLPDNTLNSFFITSVSTNSIGNYNTTSQRFTGLTSGDTNESGGLATMTTFISDQTLGGNTNPGWAEQGTYSSKIIQGWVDGWRDFAPIIESDYHLDLCDYAIYLASAKKNPELSAKHQQIWEKRIYDVINDNVDRDLQFSIKEAI